MDLQMPLISGLEAAKAIRVRELGTGTHLPIIAMTAHSLKGDKELCLAAGMDGYVSKPIHKSDLEAEMNRLLRRSTSENSDSSCKEKTLDGEELLSRVDGDRALLGELAGIFREDYPKHIQTLRSALAESDSEAVHRIGHLLKGMLANLAAPRARGLAAQLEELGKERELQKLGPVLDELQMELHRLEEALGSLSKGVQSENPAR
jgi:two-component system, sensor histidine kinase and response regulator